MAVDREELADSLAATYASTLPTGVTDRIFALAWEHGHANGESEVEFFYVDLADLAITAYFASGNRTPPGAEGGPR